MACIKAALYSDGQQANLSRSRVCEADEIADLVFRELGVVHVLLSGKTNRVSIFLVKYLYKPQGGIS